MAKKQKRKPNEGGFGYTVGAGPYKGQRVYIAKTMFDDNKAYQKYKKRTIQSRYVKNVRTVSRFPANKSRRKR